uniref:Zinc finger protein 574 n=1 Tax=Neolamprologus brichardi TaxID=32507 RepID=A0A3Q4HYH8_NEOBR
MPETSSVQSATIPLYSVAESSFSQHETNKNIDSDAVEKALHELEQQEGTETNSSQSSDPPISEVVSVSNPDESSPRRRGANKKPKPEPVLLCVDCGSCFGLVSELVAHRKTQHGFEEALHRCSVCGESFLNTTLFLYHRKQHRQKGEEKAVEVTELTSEVFTQSNGADQQDHGATSASASVDCLKLLTLILVIVFVKVCTKSFTNSQSLLRHSMSHTGNKPFSCDVCGKNFSQAGLDLHRLSHTGQTPLKCPVRPCRRRFISNSALEEHVLAHFQGTLSKSKNRPRFRCQICHKEFAYNSTFNVHMRTHTDERPFEVRSTVACTCVKDHERIHSGVRPFCCWICGKSFSVAARLTEHARTHSGEKPYPCPHCPAAFRSRSNLDKHIRLHGDLPLETAEQVVNAAEAAQVQKVLEGAKALSSLATVEEVESGSVQTIYVLQGAEGATETVMIPSDQLSSLEGASQVVILPSSVLGTQAITLSKIMILFVFASAAVAHYRLLKCSLWLSPTQ